MSSIEINYIENKTKHECSAEYDNTIVKFEIEETVFLDLCFKSLIEGLEIILQLLNSETKDSLIIKFPNLFISSLFTEWIDIWKLNNFEGRPNKAYLVKLSEIKDKFLEKKIK